MGGKEKSSHSLSQQKSKNYTLGDGPVPAVTGAPSSPGHRDIMVSATWDPTLLPWAPRAVTPSCCHLRATSALPSPAPSPLPWRFGRCQEPAPCPCRRGDSSGTELGEALGCLWGCRGWVCADTESLGFAVAAVAPTGQICVPACAAGAECGVGVAATCPQARRDPLGAAPRGQTVQGTARTARAAATSGS